MSQQYEFEEDEAPKPERKKFIPGLDQPVPAAPPAAAAPPVAAGAPSSAVRQPVAAPAAPAQEGDDPDLKPGSRKDLWACPHCGTRNKPDRTQCRSCGKSPTDAKAIPFWKSKPFLGGIAGGFVAVVLLWAVTRPDLSLKEPGKASIDIGSAATAERELAGKTFTPRKRISICGRIVAGRPTPGADGATDVVVILGKASDEAVGEAKPAFNNQRIDDLPPGAQVLHLITGEKLSLERGAWISVVGDYGTLAENTFIVSDSGKDEYTVAVDHLKQ